MLRLIVANNMNHNLLIGVPHIDDQHYEIFRSFQCLLSSGAGDESISEALSRLTNQIHEHFKAEEAFMVGLNMPAADFHDHQKAHSQIVESLTTIHLDTMQGLRVSLEEIISRVSVYVHQHVIEHDLPLKAYTAN